MSFIKLVHARSKETADSHNSRKVSTPKMNKEASDKDSSTAEAVLRGAHFKIKLVLPTKFGTQIDFAKQYDSNDIESALVDFDINIKNNSVFVFN